MPVVTLHTLERKENVGAPHVVSKREAHPRRHGFDVAKKTAAVNAGEQSETALSSAFCEGQGDLGVSP